MAKDTFVNEKINEYQDAIKEAARGTAAYKLHSVLRLFAKEIERETRHKAAEMANQLSRDITNL